MTKRKNAVTPIPGVDIPAPHEPRILAWDIETDGIQADRVLCIGWKIVGQPQEQLFTYDGFGRNAPWWSDKKLLTEFAEVFEQCDMHVTWYGSRFDQPVVEGRMIQVGLGPLPPKPHIDLWKLARTKLGHRRQGHRLQAWQDRLGLREDKTPVKPSVWIAARHGDKSALQYIYDHCRQDVKVLEEVFLKMRPWVENQPAWGLFTGEAGVCPSCGSWDVHRKGFKVALTRVYQQWKCNSCGRWWRGTDAVSKTRTRG